VLGSIGPFELLIIVVVAILLLGGKEWLHVVRNLAKGWNDIKKATRHVKDEIREMMDDKEKWMG